MTAAGPNVCPMPILIRPVETIEDSRLIESLIAQIWSEDPRIIVPDHFIITIARNGGVALLAFDDDRPVGFCLGFLGLTEDGRLKHCSHMNGVLPAYQSGGLGYRLKLAQRRAVLAQRIDHVTWTYDPLETRNANLNLHKLGAVCRTYRREVYGQMRDALNQGLPSDRFQVDWWIASDWVRQRVEGGPAPDRPTLREWQARGAPLLNPARENRQGLPEPASAAGPPDSKTCLLEVPANFQAIKAGDLALALAWRMHTRALFEQAFALGYTAVDLLYEQGRCYYLLEKDWEA